MYEPPSDPHNSGGSVLDRIGEIILHHVSNSEPIIVLPTVFGVNLSITKHVIMLWSAAAIVFVLFAMVVRPYRSQSYPVPRGFANLVESMVEYIRNQVVIPNVGKAHARAWSPLILTFFFFILVANGLGLVPFFDLLPGGSTATGNFNVTAGLATVTFFSIIVAGSLAHGFGGYWRSLAPRGHPFPVYFLLVPIEIIAMFVKPFALTMRLAANMTGGHIAILSILSFIFVFSDVFRPEVGLAVGALVSVPLSAAISALELIIVVIQAYVFTLLSTIFIGMAIHVEH